MAFDRRPPHLVYGRVGGDHFQNPHLDPYE